jgi:hypothetical protein
VHLLSLRQTLISGLGIKDPQTASINANNLCQENSACAVGQGMKKSWQLGSFLFFKNIC